MYSVVAIVFWVMACMVIVGFLGGIGSNGFSDVSKNVASSLGLLCTYTFLIVGMSSLSELASIYENLLGGIPFVQDIADYGSLQRLISEDPLSAVVSFLDAVILSAIIELIMLLPLGHNQNKIHFFTNIPNVMTNLFVATVAAIVGLLILNYVVKELSIYRRIVTIIGGAIAVLSAGSIPLQIISLFKKKNNVGMGVIGAVLLLSTSPVVTVLRKSFLKAIVYVGGIWALEKHFGSIANGLSQLSIFLMAIGPAIVMIIGLVIIIKSVK